MIFCSAFAVVGKRTKNSILCMSVSVCFGVRSDFAFLRERKGEWKPNFVKRFHSRGGCAGILGLHKRRTKKGKRGEKGFVWVADGWIERDSLIVSNDQRSLSPLICLHICFIKQSQKAKLPDTFTSGGHFHWRALVISTGNPKNQFWLRPGLNPEPLESMTSLEPLGHEGKLIDSNISNYGNWRRLVCITIIQRADGAQEKEEKRTRAQLKNLWLG